MNIESQIEKISRFQHLELLANQVVEGFISGMHKSPFHGFSAEFAEHKVYNTGESTRHIYWKLFAKTDRLYTKRYEEETNLRCHLIVDNSSSMHYPKLNGKQQFYESKIGFSVLASAVLMNLLKKQRDGVGLSVYSDTYEYYAPEKGSERHHRMLLNTLEGLLQPRKESKSTDTVTYLHQIAEKMHRRSMIVIDTKTELNFDFDNAPRKFVDLETGEEVNVFAENLKQEYEKQVDLYFQKIAMTCMQNKIKYVPVNVGENFEKILT